MGGCCSSDVIPPVPKNIQPDPKENEVVECVITALKGSWLATIRDFAVYKGNQIPKAKDKQKDNMWLWFNKENADKKGKKVIVDLENFHRPAEDQKAGKGQILWRAKMDEKPRFKQKHRFQSLNKRSGFSFNRRRKNNSKYSYDSDDDEFYVSHSNRKYSRGGHGSKEIGPIIMTKWCCDTTAEITPGNTGRGEEYFGKDPVKLEVFAKGTGVTRWTKERHERTDKDGKKHVSYSIKKHVDEYVDIIEYTVVHKNELWDAFAMDGDKKEWGKSKDLECDNRFFTSVMSGGWFSANKTNITTKGGDPALAMLIAHLCATEYSVVQLKKDLVLSTPQKPPSMRGMNMQSMGIMMDMAMDAMGVDAGPTFNETQGVTEHSTRVTYEGNYSGDYFGQPGEPTC